MAYEEDLAVALRWGKIRNFSVVVALVLFLIAQMVEGMLWLHYLRAAAWGVAAYAAYCEARAFKRIGRDTDMSYLRCAICELAAVICFF